MANGSIGQVTDKINRASEHNSICYILLLRMHPLINSPSHHMSLFHAI